MNKGEKILTAIVFSILMVFALLIIYFCTQAQF